MRRILMAIIGILGMVTLANAASLCVNLQGTGPGGVVTMADMIALGSDGCQIDDKVFYDFGYVPGGSAPTAGEVTIGFDETPLDPGLVFTAGFAAVSGTTTTAKITYTVDVLPGGNPITDFSIGIGGITQNNPGAIFISEDGCLGGTWNASGSSCNSGNVASLDIYIGPGAANNQFDIAYFDPVLSVDIFKDITVIGGDGGLAKFSEMTQNFSEIPEPGTLALLGGGLLIAGIASRRRYKR